MGETGKISWLSSLRAVPAKWRRRSRAERALLLEAFILLGVARAGVLLLSMRWLTRSLGRHMQEDQSRVAPACMRTARMVGGAVRSAAGWTPWGSVCLPQAAAAKWMLKRRNIPATVYLGVMKDESRPEKLVAHAWVRCGEFILTGAKGHQQYTVVSKFS